MVSIEMTQVNIGRGRVMTEFSGRVVVITGAAHGLGEALAGARLALCDIESEGLAEVVRLLKGRGTEVITGIVDVTQAAQFEEFSEQVYEEFGHVDVLVNNAGVMLAGRMDNMTLEDWRWIVGINIWGVIHGTHFFYPRMSKRGSGDDTRVAGRGRRARSRLHRHLPQHDEHERKEVVSNMHGC
jgi:NADP-dependent 3-hydroxy acid dehydrogenase YdfG